MLHYPFKNLLVVSVHISVFGVSLRLHHFGEVKCLMCHILAIDHLLVPWWKEDLLLLACDASLGILLELLQEWLTVL